MEALLARSSYSLEREPPRSAVRPSKLLLQVACYYNYVNRLADGLGVELEAQWPEGDHTLTAAGFEER